MKFAAVLFGVMLGLSGCRGGLVGFEGWAVKTENAGNLQFLDDRPGDAPNGVIRPVWVELRTLDGERLLSRNESVSGYFSVSHVGLLQSGLKYAVRAGAPGFDTVERTVRLREGEVTWGLIELGAERGHY